MTKNVVYKTEAILPNWYQMPHCTTETHVSGSTLVVFWSENDAIIYQYVVFIGSWYWAFIFVYKNPNALYVS